MSVGVMTVEVMSVEEITVGVMTVGVMTVGVMRRPRKGMVLYIFTSFCLLFLKTGVIFALFHWLG